MKRVKEFLIEHWLSFSVVLFLILWTGYSYFRGGMIFSLINSDVDSVVASVQSFGILAAFVLVFLVILEVVLAPIPPLALYIVAGLLFGGFFGGILILTGNIIGALIDFKIAHKIGLTKEQKNKKIVKKFNKFFDKYGGLSIFVLRINPLTTSDLVSYLSGLTRIKTKNFLIATTLGLIPIIFVQTYLGDIWIKENPILSAIVIIFSLFYLLIFIYVIFQAIVTRGRKIRAARKLEKEKQNL